MTSSFIDYFSPNVIKVIDDMFMHVVMGTFDENVDHLFLIDTYKILEQHNNEWMICSDAQNMHFLHIKPQLLETFFKVYFMMGDMDESTPAQSHFIRLWAVAHALSEYPQYLPILPRIAADLLPTLDDNTFEKTISTMAVLTAVFYREHRDAYYNLLRQIAEQLDETRRLPFLVTLHTHFYLFKYNYRDYHSTLYDDDILRQIEHHYPNASYFDFSERLERWNMMYDYSDPQWASIQQLHDTAKYLFILNLHSFRTNNTLLSIMNMKEFLRTIDMTHTLYIEGLIDRIGDQECRHHLAETSVLTFLPPGKQTASEIHVHF